MREIVVIAHRLRTAITGLNTVVAALDVDLRTRGTVVRFAHTLEQTILFGRAASTSGARPLVAWSCYSTDAPRTLTEFARARSALEHTGALHVIGGVHATSAPEAMLDAGFGLVVLGEGEATFVELVARLAAGQPYDDLAGTARLEHGRFVRNARGPRRPLDDFPSFHFERGPWSAIEITRGCAFACAFCQTPFAFGARFRHRSVPSVQEHVRAMRGANGVRYVRFLSPTAFSYGSADEKVELGQIEALLAAAREAAGRDARLFFGTFPSEVRPEHVSAQVLAILARHADNRTLVIGGQSGSESVLASMHRGHGVEAIVRAVRIARENAFVPDVDFLFGLPGEALEDRHASLRLAHELIGLGARIHAHSFLPLPGTPLRDAAPETIEPEIAAELARLESSGALHGQWRAQIVRGQALALQRGTP